MWERMRALAARFGVTRKDAIVDWDLEWPRDVHHTFEQIIRAHQGRTLEKSRLVKLDEQGLATIKGDLGLHQTSLNSCTCADFAERGLPCAHMYLLADLYELLEPLPRRSPAKLRTLDRKKEIQHFVDLYEAGEISYDDLVAIGNAIKNAR